MRSARQLLVIGLVLGLVASACGGTADVDESSADTDETTVSDDEPSEPESPAEDATTDAVDETLPPEDEEAGPEVAVFFVRSNDAGIWVEPETHELDRPTEAVAHAAIDLLFTGTPHDPELTSAGPDDVQVLATNIRDRVLIVDVSEEIATHSTGSAEELAFAEQLAHTAAAFPTVDRVQLWVAGEPIDELWGHLEWSEPIDPDPFALSPITIAEPRAGPGEPTFPPGEIVLRGEATVFEANFGIRLYGPDGELVAEDFVTASEGGPGRGDWEHAFTITEPGTYLVEAEEDDPSDGEGRPPFVTTRQLEVR